MSSRVYCTNASISSRVESAQYLKPGETNIHDMQYSALLGGFAIVMANGRGGFLSASNARFEPEVIYFCNMNICML